jgi:hypothetical protein
MTTCESVGKLVEHDQNWGALACKAHSFIVYVPFVSKTFKEELTPNQILVSLQFFHMRFPRYFVFGHLF